MNLSNLLRISLFLILFSLTNNTTITFYVDHEVEQPLDFVQINAIIKTSDDSLEATIQAAADIIADVQQTVQAYCRSYAKEKGECENIVETDPYSIKPQYELIKKKPVFGGFVVAHEMLIRVKESPLFGKLVDDIMKKGVNKINSLEWKPLNEVDGEEIAVEEGIAQAKQMCKKIGMQLDSIVSVEEVTDFGEDQQDQQEEGEGEKGEDQEQEQEQQQQPLDIKDGIIYYKFVVECLSRKK